MKKSLVTMLVALLTLLAPALPAVAQDTKDEKPQAKAAQPQSIYKLDLAVYELQDGKKTNLRKYIMFIKSGGSASSIKVGNRVPVNTGNSTASSPQIQYMDVGLSLRCRDISEKDGMVSLNTDFELGSLILPEHPDSASQGAPVVRQLREDGVALIPLGKPSIVMSIEDTNSPRTVQLEVTATRM